VVAAQPARPPQMQSNPGLAVPPGPGISPSRRAHAAPVIPLPLSMTVEWVSWRAGTSPSSIPPAFPPTPTSNPQQRRPRADWSFFSPQMRYVRKLYRSIDVDGSGSISVNELESFFEGAIVMKDSPSDDGTDDWSMGRDQWPGEENELDKKVIILPAGDHSGEMRIVKIDWVSENRLALYASANTVGSLSVDDFFCIQRATQLPVVRRRKIALVAAKLVRKADMNLILHDANGRPVSSRCKPMDYIVTSLDPEDFKPILSPGGQKHQWIVEGENFDQLYEIAGELPDREVAEDVGEVYSGKNMVYSVHFSGGLSVSAPWGQIQHFTSPAFLFCSKKTGEVYGCDEDTCFSTYVVDRDKEKVGIGSTTYDRFKGSLLMTKKQKKDQEKKWASVEKWNRHRQGGGRTGSFTYVKQSERARAINELERIAGNDESEDEDEGLSNDQEGEIGLDFVDEEDPRLRRKRSSIFEDLYVTEMVKLTDGVNATMQQVLSMLRSKMRESSENNETIKRLQAQAGIVSDQSMSTLSGSTDEDSIVHVFQDIKSSQRFPPTISDVDAWIVFRNIVFFFLLIPVFAFPSDFRARHFGWFRVAPLETMKRGCPVPRSEKFLYAMCCTIYFLLIFSACCALPSLSNYRGGSTGGTLIWGFSGYLGLALTIVIIAGKPYAQWSSDFSLIKLLDYIVLVKETNMGSFGCAKNPWIRSDFRRYYTAYDLYMGVVYNGQLRQVKDQMKKWNWLNNYVGMTGAVFCMKYYFPILLSLITCIMPVVARAALASSEKSRGLDHVTLVVQATPLGYAALIIQLLCDFSISMVVYCSLQWVWLQYKTFLEQLKMLSMMTNPRYVRGKMEALLTLDCPENVEAWRLIRNMMVLQNSVPQRHTIFGVAVVADLILTTLVLCSVMFKLCNLGDVKTGYSENEFKYFGEECGGISGNEYMLIAQVLFLSTYIFSIMGILVHTNKHLTLQMKRMKQLSDSMIERDPLANELDVMRSTYSPDPPDLSDLIIPDHARGAVDRLAENAHDVWTKSKIDAGWSYGKINNVAKKEHSQLIPYSLLSEEERSYDYLMVTECIRGVLSLGFRIMKPPKGASVDLNLLEVRVPDEANLPHGYEPIIINTAAVKLPPETLLVCETLAEHLHNKWAIERMNEGYRWGATRVDAPEEGYVKTHPLLQPYALLSECEKESNRNTVKGILKGLMALGFKVERQVMNKSTLFLPKRTRQRLARKILQSVVSDGTNGLITMLGVQVTEQFRNTVIGVITSIIFSFFLAIFVEGKVG